MIAALFRGAPKRLTLQLVCEVAAVVLISAFFCFWKIGDWSFGDGDQTIHSKVVQEMIHKGHWLNPTSEGRPYFSKPPLKMWIVAVIVSIFGESNTTYRFLDALIGVCIAVFVWAIARRLFQSAAVAMFSVFSLLSCYLFFWGHGVRTATQDSMMLLLVSGVIWLGYLLVEELEKSLNHERRARIFRLTMTAAILTSLAVMTKSVAGLMGAIVVFMYLLTSGQLLTFLRGHIKTVVLSTLAALAFPVAYWVPHFIIRPRTYAIAVEHEVVERATKGFHHVANNMYYLEVILRDRMTVVPGILAIAIVFAIYRIFRRDRRFLLLTIWATFPVLLFTVMSSRLFWYIFPALPGMSLLCGALIGGALDSLIHTIRTPFRLRLNEKFRVAVLGIFVAVSSFFTFQSIYKATEVLFGPGFRTPVDLITQFELRQPNRVSTEPQVARFRFSRLARDEHFYWDMLGVAATRDANQLKAAFHANPKRFYVITSTGHVRGVANTLPIDAYTLIPPRNLRREWLAVLYSGEAPIPSELKPAKEVIDAENLNHAFGLSFQRPVPAGIARVAERKRAGIILPGDYVRRTFGTGCELKISSPTKSSTEPVHFKVSMNDRLVGEFTVAASEFWRGHFQQLDIAHNLWETGSNLLTIESDQEFALHSVALTTQFPPQKTAQ